MSEEWIESYEEIPVIDIFCENNLSESALFSLLTACNEWGVFYITNHGVSKEFFQRLVSGADQLFCYPDETKRKLKMGVGNYTPRFVVSPSIESFKVVGPHFSASAAAQGFTESLFGYHATEFSKLLDEYGSKMKEVSKRVVQLLLRILGENFDKKFYDPEFSNCNGYLRLNGYSPPNLKEGEEVEVFGMHTDISWVTILFQDDVGGLQMRSKGGALIEVRPREDALVVNIGNFMEAWSNGRLRSAEHRVVLRKNHVKRFSVGFFLIYENDDREIYAPSEVVGEGNTRLYRPFSTKEYRMFKEKTYEKVISVTVKDFAGIAE